MRVIYGFITSKALNKRNGQINNKIGYLLEMNNWD